MNNHHRGEKRTCPNCGAKFYDLGRAILECPKCKTEIDIKALNDESKVSKSTLQKDIKEENQILGNDNIKEAIDDDIEDEEESEEETSTIVNID